MKTSTRLIVTVAASVLGVGLAAGGAYAATGSLSVSDAPGQVLKVSGVGPASTHASDEAKAHANANAKGIFGDADPTATPTPSPTETVPPTTAPAPTIAPVAPTTAAKDASTVKGNLTGMEIEAWAHSKTSVETVEPDAAVEVHTDTSVHANAGH